MTTELQKLYFFSIIIPAHNEEKYVGETLEKIKKLKYPKTAFEVWVIENGSTDSTFDVAKKHTNEGENIMVLSSPEKGVSKAKNFGLSKISSGSEWVIFLDADVILEENFLVDLNDFLRKNSDKKMVIGTTEILPSGNTGWYAKAWYKFYDFGHKNTKTSYAIQIMNSSLKNKIQFDTTLTLAEDLKFFKDALFFGKFFFFKTKTVLASTRRFEEVGWFKLFFIWNWDALIWRLSDKKTQKKEYKVIR